MGRTDVAALACLMALLSIDDDAPLPASADGWDAVIELAVAHELLAALWVRLRDAGRMQPIPTGARIRLEEHLSWGRDVPELALQRMYEVNVARQVQITGAATAAIEVLTAAGLTVLPLKGLHTIAAGLWPDPAVRTMADIDLLAAPGAGAQALRVLCGGGFTLAETAAGEFADHQQPPLRSPDGVFVEVHDRVLRSPWHEMLPTDTVFRASAITPGPFGSRPLMSDTHAVVALIAHAQLQDDTYRRWALPLRALVETDRWVRVRGDSIDWSAIVRRFDAAGEQRALLAHCFAAHRLLGTPLPAEVASLDDRRARRHDQLTALGTRVPRVRRAAVYLEYLPRSFSAARMADAYGPQRGRIWLWAARARHVTTRAAVRSAHGLRWSARVSARPFVRVERWVEARTERTRRRIRTRWRRTFVELNHDLRRTILVVGGGRSGTTWFSEVINWRRDHRFIFEPFRPVPVPAAAPFTEGEYVDPDDADPARVAGATTILSGQIRSHWTDRYNRVHLVRRRIVKCIRICNLVPWVQHQFPDLRLVLLIRHPGAVAASRIRAGFPDLVDEYRALPGLCDGPLQPFADAIERFAASDDRFERHVLRWCMENWIPLALSDPSLHVVCYEDLVLHPERELDRLAQTLGVPMDGRVVRRLLQPGSIKGDSANLAATRAGKVDAWTHHIDPDARERAAEMVAAFGLDGVYGVAPEPRCASDQVLATVRAPLVADRG